MSPKRSRLPARPPAAATLPLDVEYADDTDFTGSSRTHLLGGMVAHNIRVENGTQQNHPPRKPDRGKVAYDTPPGVTTLESRLYRTAITSRLRR